jgi:hypothetical protein
VVLTRVAISRAMEAGARLVYAAEDAHGWRLGAPPIPSAITGRSASR